MDFLSFLGLNPVNGLIYMDTHTQANTKNIENIHEPMSVSNQNNYDDNNINSNNINNNIKHVNTHTTKNKINNKNKSKSIDSSIDSRIVDDHVVEVPPGGCGCMIM